MGLTGGIVDVGGLYDCLVGIDTGKAGPEILDSYNKIRQQKYNDIVNPISSSNIRRLYDQDPEKALENDDFLKLLKKAEKDDALARVIQLVSYINRLELRRPANGVSRARMSFSMTLPRCTTSRMESRQTDIQNLLDGLVCQIEQIHSMEQVFAVLH